MNEPSSPTPLANAFGRDEAERSELRHVLWMVVYSLGLAFLEQRALFGKPTPSQDVLDHAEWVVGAAERLLRLPSGEGRCDSDSS